jgi:cysteinyl-tRNA synthetase
MDGCIGVFEVVKFHTKRHRAITDIDDKIIKRAIENGETIQQLTNRFIAAHARGCRCAWRAAPPITNPALPNTCRKCST